ncbi:MAG: histidine kinase [Bacteroidota bacterium]
MQTSRPISQPDPLQWISSLLLYKARPLGHVAFWLGVLFFYTLYFGGRQDGYEQNLVFIGLLLPITIATTYFLLYWLIPRYLFTQRYGLFILYLCYSLLFSLYLELLLVLLLYINVSGYQTMFVKPGLVDLLDVLVGMYLVVALAVAINLLKRWSSAQAQNAALEKAKMETELKLKEAELQLLKSQIHPHFLFNTLNNLYALALEKSPHVPDVILRISQQLDYILHKSNQAEVSLDEELGQLQNYISLEALRHDPERVSVSFETTGNTQHLSIAPLLLIPFVENSFKHGIDGSAAKAWIKIQTEVADDKLHFSVSNSMLHPKAQLTLKRPPIASGIGLRNVRRRLTLHYPNRHTLDISHTDAMYSVNLTLLLHA